MLRNFPLARIVLLFVVALAMPRSAWGEESLDQRRQRLENMSVSEKQELLEKKKRFDRLDPDEQRRLRELHRDVSKHPHCDQLRQVMVRYNDWLATLESYQRVELQKLSGPERIDKIKELMRQQQAKTLHHMVDAELSPNDLRVIFKWLGRYLENHRSELVESLPPERRKRLEEIDDPEKRRHMLLFATFSRRREGSPIPLPTAEEMQQLMAELSPKASEKLKQARQPGEKMKLMQSWVRAAMFARMTPKVSDDQLMRFFSEKLTPQQRAPLENLSRERMLAELRRMYRAHLFRQRHGNKRPSHFNRPPHGGPSRRLPPPGGRPRARQDRSPQQN